MGMGVLYKYIDLVESGLHIDRVLTKSSILLTLYVNFKWILEIKNIKKHDKYAIYWQKDNISIKLKGKLGK